MAKSESDKKLSAKEELFCNEYIRLEYNTFQAMMSAGYAESYAKAQGYKMLENVGILTRIEELKKERIERTKIDADYILTSIDEVVKRCMQKVPVMVKTRLGEVQSQDEEGNNIWRFDASGALKGLELLGKHIGFFEVDNSQKADQTFKIITETVTKKV